MINIKKKYNQWEQFKEARKSKPYLSFDDEDFITMNDREKLIDELFEYIDMLEKKNEPQENHAESSKSPKKGCCSLR